MSDHPDEHAHSQAIEKALATLRGDDPTQARVALQEAIEENPGRLDLVHALAVTELRLGKPRAALEQVAKGIALAHELQDETAAMMMPQLLLAKAAACEDLPDPGEAQAAFQQILAQEPTHPSARQGLGHLLLGWARVDEGLAELDEYLSDGADSEEYLNATRAFIEATRKVIADDVHPKMFLDAHRGAYVEFFDHHANRMAEEEGWIAEAARMVRTDSGDVVNSIPEGARPYAAVRVDLVDPNTGQGGQVGDRPMVAALAGYEALSQAPVLIDWPERDHPFGLWISTQCPWDQLPIQVRFESAETDAIAVLDPIIGDWYTAGFDGAFGVSDQGRLHYISDPQPTGPGCVQYDVDCGRAEFSAVTDLLRRLLILHDQHPISAVVLGRGYLPIGTRSEEPAEG